MDRQRRAVDLAPDEGSARQPVQQLSEPQAVKQGQGEQELSEDLPQHPVAGGEVMQQQQRHHHQQQQQEEEQVDPAHHEAVEARQEEQQQQQQQEQGRWQVEAGPEERQRTAEVSAKDAVPTQAEAWQAVHGYVRQLEVQATRSPGTVLTTVATVAVGAALVGNLLRRYLFKPSPARAPTLEELVVRYREQAGELRPVQGRGAPVPEPTAAAREAGVLELGPLVQETDEWTVEKEAKALRLEQMAAEAAAKAVGMAEAAAIDVEAAEAEPVAGKERARAVTGLGVAHGQNGAAGEAHAATGQGSSASRDRALSQAPTAEPPPPPAAAAAEPAAAAAEPAAAVGGAAAAEPAAAIEGAAAPAAAVHVLAAQPEVFILRQGHKSKAGVRIMFELQGQQLYCPIVYQDEADAQALRGPLATLFGAVLTPEDLPVVPTPTASLLDAAAEGGLALAFYPAGALLQLSFYSAEALAEAVEDEAKAEQFDDELEQLLRKQGQVLPPALVCQLAQQAQQRAKLEQAQQQGGAKQARPQQEQQGSGVSQQGSSKQPSGPPPQQQEQQQQRLGQDEHVQGRQPEQQRLEQNEQVLGHQPQQAHAKKDDAAAAAAAAAAAKGTKAAPTPLPMDWWLSLPVVHVPQLCYEDGAQGLMVVPVASLSGALRKAAGAFSGGSSGQEPGSSSNGSGGGSNGAAASSNGSGPAGDHRARDQQQQYQPQQQQEQQEQQGELSRPVERHVVAFKDLDDARALSLCALQSEQGGSAVKVQALALQPQQLLRLAQSAGYTVTVLPNGAVPISPGDRFEGVVARLHDAVQDMYWSRLAEGLKAFDEAEKQQKQEGGEAAAWE
ncbi:hypothetical protein N2152v2_002612 [Parachlorella kessleri]